MSLVKDNIQICHSIISVPELDAKFYKWTWSGHTGAISVSSKKINMALKSILFADSIC